MITAQTPLNEVSDYGFHQQNPFSIIELESGEIVIAGQALPMGESTDREAFFARYTADFELIDYTLVIEEDDFEVVSNNGREIVQIDDKVYNAHEELDAFGFIAEYDIHEGTAEYFHIVADTLGGYSFVVPTALMLNKEEQLILLLANGLWDVWIQVCLLYTSPSPRDRG